MELALRTVVVGAESRDVRRTLGPTAWTVLEELVLESMDRNGVCVSRVSVRSIARTLGIDKSTAARALRRLRSSGIVEAVQHRSSAGEFDAGAYRVTLPVGVTVVTAPQTASTTRARVRRADVAQLSLLDAG